MYITGVLPVIFDDGFCDYSHGIPSSKTSGWLVLQNGWADIFHRWDVDSTQLELARSVIK